MAGWLVAHAQQYGISQIQYAGFVWWECNRLFDGSFDRFLSYAWRRHLAEAVRRKLEPHDTDQIVGFADLVGYSSLANRIEPQALPDLISQFEQLAYRSVSPTGGQGNQAHRRCGDVHRA